MKNHVENKSLKPRLEWENRREVEKRERGFRDIKEQDS